jgi:hypothetical protein
LCACVVDLDQVPGRTRYIDIITTNFQPPEIEIDRVLLMMPKVAQLRLGRWIES